MSFAHKVKRIIKRTSVGGAGSRVIASRVGSFATPLATLTLSGSGAGVFVLPIVPTLPAGGIPPHSRV